MKSHQQAIAPARVTGTSRGAARLIGACLIAAALCACGGGGGGGASHLGGPASAANQVAPNPSDAWTLVPAAEVGMDAAILAKAAAQLPADGSHGVSSMLVMRHGKPVVEQYWNGYDKDTLHDLRSATKSITSLLTGIAIDQRLIGGVQETLSSHLGTAYPNAPAFSKGVRLVDLLTMRSGLDCNDWINSSPGHEDKMYKASDWLKFYTDLQAIAAPGDVTRYCSGNPVALGRVVAQASKKSIPAFADEFLFGPLNIQSARWASFEGGRQTDTGGHMFMRPRDMARVGQLVLQKGMWNGRQLVSEAWIAESTSLHTQFVDIGLRNGYGYLWWRGVQKVGDKSYDMVFANGAGGQYIIVVPALDIVAVFTGENYNSAKAEFPFVVLDAYLLGAVK